jgi:hypothetical protein
MTRCPTTDREVPTVYRMSSAQLAVLEGEFAFRCTLCDEIHRWRREAAWVEEAGERPAAVA